ncbi:MAG: helix-turn-helix domain-containing protein [Ferruginibacter sp.]
MVTTSLILPQPVLRDFIHYYSLCKSGFTHVSITSPLFAHHDTSICFFLSGSPVYKTSSETVGKERIHKVSLFGLMTHCAGSITVEGNYETFIIEFRPNGFNKMFGIPAGSICNTIFPANEVIGNCIEHFYEELLRVTGATEMASLANKFLIGFLNRQKAVYFNDGITKISNQLLTSIYTNNIPQYAYQANMSMRNFERRFVEQVGTSPKLFCRLLRFNTAVKFKIIDPEKSWNQIADECGYYDDMHMIKEFKQFANASPATLFKDNPWYMEETFTTIEQPPF